MRIGMTMPVMEPNLDAATLKAWARAIDGGPFSSLCWGQRIAFDNPDKVTLPHLAPSFWFALGDVEPARLQMHPAPASADEPDSRQFGYRSTAPGGRRGPELRIEMWP